MTPVRKVSIFLLSITNVIILFLWNTCTHSLCHKLLYVCIARVSHSEKRRSQFVFILMITHRKKAMFTWNENMFPFVSHRLRCSIVRIILSLHVKKKGKYIFNKEYNLICNVSIWFIVRHILLFSAISYVKLSKTCELNFLKKKEKEKNPCVIKEPDVFR